MLTDDDLSRELGAAFHATTGDITYTGRRQPPRSRAAVALPVAAGVVAIAAGGYVATAEPPTTGTQAARADGATASPTMVRDSISLAGLTLHYERQAGWPDPVRVDRDVERVPDDARPISLADGARAKAWIGVDPESGDNAAYLQSPARNGGETFAIVSSSWTQDQLVDLVLHGRPD